MVFIILHSPPCRSNKSEKKEKGKKDTVSSHADAINHENITENTFTKIYCKPVYQSTLTNIERAVLRNEPIIDCPGIAHSKQSISSPIFSSTILSHVLPKQQIRQQGLVGMTVIKDKINGCTNMSEIKQLLFKVITRLAMRICTNALKLNW